MKTLFQKLKLENQQEILILNEPDGFVAQFQELVGIDVIESLILVNKVEFALVFVETIEEFESQIITLLPKLKDDVILWIAHPRTISKKYSTDITDNYHWPPLTKECYEQVSSLKVNEDWEALRFRKMEYLQCLERKQKQTKT